MNELNKLVNPCGEQLCGRSERYSGTRVSPTCSSSSLKNITNAFPAPTTTPILAERAGNQNLLALVVAMLIFAILTLSLTVLTMWHGPVASDLALSTRHTSRCNMLAGSLLRPLGFGRHGSGPWPGSWIRICDRLHAWGCSVRVGVGLGSRQSQAQLDWLSHRVKS
jgi:hypothetical protein